MIEIKTDGRKVNKHGLRDWILWSLPTTMISNGKTDSDQLLVWYIGEGDDRAEICRSEGGKRTYTPLFFKLAREVIEHVMEDGND
jgi:hypothetical protein